MDQLSITIPDWVICVAGVWFIMQAIENGVSIYLFYLKLKNMGRTTSSTAEGDCQACKYYKNGKCNFCAPCSKDYGKIERWW